METKKVLTIIFSLVFVALFGFVLSWGIINFNKVKEGMSGTELYTNEDLKNSYQDGYDTALQDKVEYEELINGYRDNITTLTDNISSLNSQVAALTNVNKDYQNQIKNLNEIKQLNEETIAQLNGTISLNTITIDELNSQVNSLTNTKTSNENTIKSLNKTIEENNALISSLNAEIDELESEVENNETTIEELNNQISLLQTENSNKQLEIDTLTTTNSSLNNQITNLNSLVNELQTSNDNNLSTIQSLNNQISLQKAQIVELQNQQNANDVSIYELNNKITDLEKSIDYYESYIFELESANHLVGIFEFNGSVYSICEVDDNGLVSVENPESTEFVIFNYWTVNGEQVDLSNYVLTENTKFVADVTYNYKVKFLVDDSVYNEQLVENGNKVVLPENPSKEKYDFVGWSLNGVDVVDLTDYLVDSNINLIALFQSSYGLFNADTGALVYSWDELQHYNYIIVDENNVLSAGANSKRLSGDLILDNDIVEIADNTFNGCAAIRQVYLGDKITTIGKTAFKQCYSLEKVEFHNSVKNINSMAFANCSALVDVNFIGDLNDWLDIVFVEASANPSAFSYGVKFNNVLFDGDVVIEKEITEINNYAFYNMPIKSLVMPNTVKKLGYSAFKGSTIESIQFSNTLEEIGNSCFQETTKLVSADLPASLKTIKSTAFYKSDLRDVVLGENLEFLGGNAFSYNYNLTNLRILGDVVFDGHDQFSFTTNLKSVYVNGDLVCDDGSVYGYFSNSGIDTDTGITLTIGKDVTVIPEGFFGWNVRNSTTYYAPKLTYINFDSECKITTIGDYAFKNCTQVASVVLPASLTYAGKLCFWNCYDTKVYFADTSNWTVNGSAVEVTDTLIQTYLMNPNRVASSCFPMIKVVA